MASMAQHQSVVASDDRPFLHTIGRWLFLLILALFALLLGQAVSFTNFVGDLGNWQFARFGRYFPAATIILPLVFVAIVWVALAALWRRRRRHAAQDMPRMQLIDAQRVAMTLAALAALAAVAVSGHYLTLPSADAAPASADLSRSDANRLPEGPLRLSGIVPAGPASRYAEDVIINRRESMLVPIARNRDGALSLFVELPMTAADATPPPLAARHEGLLRRNALPSEIAHLYRGEGIAVDARAAVLFHNARNAYASVLTLLGEFITLALIALGFGLWLRRAERRRRERLGRERTAVQPA